MKEHRMIVAQPGEAAVIKTFKKNESYQALRDAIGGCFDLIHLGPGLDAYIHDEGLLLGMPFNRRLGWYSIYGPIVFTASNDEGDTIGLTDPQVSSILERYGEPQSLWDLSALFPEGTPYKIPVYATGAVRALVEKGLEEQPLTDLKGYAWDLLWMSRAARVRRIPLNFGELIEFQVVIGRKLRHLFLSLEPGQDMEPIGLIGQLEDLGYEDVLEGAAL